ncbi:angiopoietin-related protein 7-like [Patiria miniata]|uniref:Fibrinogen C-terminal domain-containing protein n=1 Tax=Patiria miniata TaxID=46514 RepID=A0A914AIQ3_PATMI|nr:angiopoietin-related protein 7-like [Patiria miniata]XP_038063529.1 angiopoietin-related protein 7-like [Patiria miniata]
MLPIFSLCLVALAATCMSQTVVQPETDNDVPRDDDIQQCIDNDALTTEILAAMESAIKISQYGTQAEKLKALKRVEKHVSKMRQIIRIEEEESAKLRDCSEVQHSGATESGVYTITPPGSEAIEVYCDMITDGGGWTVFQRRQDGTESFDRLFEDYSRGFGESDGEFWLGNTALQALTAEGKVDLRLDMWDWEGNYKYATYSGFRVSGEDFTLRFTENSYQGTAGDSLSYHNGKGFTTRDHDVDGAGSGNCAVWLYSGWWFDLCHRANLNGRYKNELDATEGMEQDQGIQWMAWKGNRYSLSRSEMKLRQARKPSLESTRLPSATSAAADCAEIMASGILESGVYSISAPGMDPVEVYCDMDTDGGGWTVFQRQESALVNFDQGFQEYSEGFGEAAGDYWLGNSALRRLTDAKRGGFELRVDLWDWDDTQRYATYQNFSVSGEHFTLHIGEYSGDAGDSLTYHNGKGFTTRDNDVDGALDGNCAVWLYSGWWFDLCHRANLNGRYMNELDATTGMREDQGIQWMAWKGNQYSLKKSEMKVRPMA